MRVLDFDEPDNNDWLAVNQFTVVENRHERRADIVLFVNGLPLAVIELKNAAAENATIWTAFNQLQTYKGQIPSLFTFNEALVISDGIHARIGTLTADREWFLPWRTIDGDDAGRRPAQPSSRSCSRGVFDSAASSISSAHFIVFEDAGDGVLVKKMAGYHQFHAVNAAIEETVRACAPGPQSSQLGDSAASTSCTAPSPAGPQARRPPHRRRLAHPGLRQEPHHGLLRRAASSSTRPWRTPPSSS